MTEREIRLELVKLALGQGYVLTRETLKTLDEVANWVLEGVLPADTRPERPEGICGKDRARTRD